MRILDVQRENIGSMVSGDRLAHVIISSRKALLNGIRLTLPAVVVLLLTLFTPVFFTKFIFVTGVESFWKILLRFFRLTIILALPILFLPYVSMFMQYLLNRGNYRLIQVPGRETTSSTDGIVG